MIATNIAYVIPRVLSFKHVIHEIIEGRQVRTANGEATQISKSKPSLTMGIGYVDPSGDINGGDSFTFGEQAANGLASLSEILTNAGVDVVAVWEAAFDAAKEKFSKTADQPESQKSVGVPWYLRVDVVQGTLNPTGNMGLSMTVGAYKDANFSKVASFFEIGFFDKRTMLKRQDQLEQIKTNIAQRTEMAAGTHVTQLEMTPDQLAKSKATAAVDLVVDEMQKAQHENALAAPLSDILNLVAVQTAFAAVAQAVFTELQAKQPDWADINVAEVMELFGPAVTKLVNA